MYISWRVSMQFAFLQSYLVFLFFWPFAICLLFHFRLTLILTSEVGQIQVLNRTSPTVICVLDNNMMVDFETRVLVGFLITVYILLTLSPFTVTRLELIRLTRCHPFGLCLPLSWLRPWRFYQPRSQSFPPIFGVPKPWRTCPTKRCLSKCRLTTLHRA